MLVTDKPLKAVIQEIEGIETDKDGKVDVKLDSEDSERHIQTDPFLEGFDEAGGGELRSSIRPLFLQ